MIGEIRNGVLAWISDKWETMADVPEHPASVFFVEVPEGIEIGWQYINGEWLEPLEEGGIIYPIQPPDITNKQISQQISDLQADLIISGTISSHSTDEWRDRYMNDMVSRATLERLVDGNIIAATAFNEWSSEHEKMYGF